MWSILLLCYQKLSFCALFTFLQFWDDDLANLAQMWANQCIWDHGFVAFGDEYPYEVPFKGRVGMWYWRKRTIHTSTSWWHNYVKYKEIHFSQNVASRDEKGQHYEIEREIKEGSKKKRLGNNITWQPRFEPGSNAWTPAVSPFLFNLFAPTKVTTVSETILGPKPHYDQQERS